jgi:hypothetical protein
MIAQRPPAPRVTVLLAVIAAAAAARPALAFDSKGHSVIEALSYRTLVEGHAGQPSRPDVLRDLIDDGALATPWCFGQGDDPSAECLAAPARNPLLCWPEPKSDRPDAFFRRQFSDSGQCFHYMGTLTDALGDPIPGTAIPRPLATGAVVRCNDLLDTLLRQVVVDGGPGTRESGFGLYELMHAVEDSFSYAHAERTPGGERVDYLRVWKPIETIAAIPTERARKIPAGVYHLWDDHRDATYVVEGGLAACEKRTDHPYDVPYACLSDEGERARQAVVELLVLVRDLRLAQRAAPPGTDTRPEASPGWQAYRAKWFTPVHPCEGVECDVREPPEPATGSYALLGVNTRFVSPGTFEATVRGSVLRYAEELNPFQAVLSASLGYQYQTQGESAGLVGLGVGLALPLGFRSDLGLTAAEMRVVFGGSGGRFELLTRLLRFAHALGGRWVLSVEAPLVVNWVQPAAHWSVGIGLSYGLTTPQVVGGSTLLHHDDEAPREDPDWVPPPAPYGRLQGRRTTVGILAGITAVSTPAVTVEGRSYGLGMLGVELVWDQDAWGGHHAFTPAVSLSAGIRNTMGDSSYLTATAGLGVRWYFLGPLGVSVTAVRVESGPKIRGKGEVDTSTGVHGSPGNEYYLLAGSRAGLALRLGIIELLVDSPTVAWAPEPFGAGEILSFTLGIRI